MTTSKPRFVYVTYISSTPDKVFNALTDAEMTKQYWGLKKNVSDWKVGSPWSHQDYETNEVQITGEVLENDPPRRLVISWASPKDKDRKEGISRVTFQVEPYMDAVRLTVSHEELEPDSPMLKGISAGWPAILSSLKTLLESGRPMAMTTKRWGEPKPTEGR